ncbi:hypothetical protein C7391_0311 [Methanimicrococcus blatticola]|uniref:Uncharacterized protein n=1 Tax=Methanimicrococcus blatticola TaxID=91560 RepID=A0A484F979_9EURY|nr:hypothetical protein C7391_0311 [Methanimicrococcus blatticola]
MLFSFSHTVSFKLPYVGFVCSKQTTGFVMPPSTSMYTMLGLVWFILITLCDLIRGNLHRSKLTPDHERGIAWNPHMTTICPLQIFLIRFYNFMYIFLQKLLHNFELCRHLTHRWNCRDPESQDIFFPIFQSLCLSDASLFCLCQIAKSHPFPLR